MQATPLNVNELGAGLLPENTVEAERHRAAFGWDVGSESSGYGLVQLTTVGAV